jgi:hypothetical protein
VTASDLHPTIDAIWRLESPRLIANLTKIVRDIGFAEDLSSEKHCRQSCHVELMLVETFSASMQSKMIAGSVAIPSRKAHSGRNTLSTNLPTGNGSYSAFQRLGSPRLESKSLKSRIGLACDGIGLPFESRDSFPSR